MTVGALYQLKLNKNSANNFLDLDPQISFFKIVYRKHTRFSMENITFDPLNRQTLDFNSNVIMKSDVPRGGDLLKNVYLTFDLPDIYSGKNTNNLKYKFKWIENIGTNIFNYISVKISDQEIERHYSDYFTIWKELMLDDEKKAIYNYNIGTRKELYEPENGPGMNGTIYPSISSSNGNIPPTSSDLHQRWDNSPPNIENNTISISDINDFSIPSINGTTIRVPLIFWFCNDPGLALPLIALQYSKVSFELEMKPFKDLYTVLHVSGSNDGKRRAPSDDNTYDMSNFTQNYNLNINPKLEGEFIFLDEDERRRFALNDHDYLITQSRLTDKRGVNILSSSTETMAKLVPAFNPVSFITWVIKRDDLTKVNDWNNYTNWVYEDVPPYSNNYNGKEEKFIASTTTDIFFCKSNANHQTKYNKLHFKKHTLKSVRIEFDGTDRINKNAEYFSKQQVYQHFKTNPKEGIYVYSFSLNPSEYQPSGSCNFSNINYPRIYFTQDSLENFNYYNHKAFIFIVSYNILSLSSGTANLKFTN